MNLGVSTESLSAQWRQGYGAGNGLTGSTVAAQETRCQVYRNSAMRSIYYDAACGLFHLSICDRRQLEMARSRASG